MSLSSTAMPSSQGIFALNANAVPGHGDSLCQRVWGQKSIRILKEGIATLPRWPYPRSLPGSRAALRGDYGAKCGARGGGACFSLPSNHWQTYEKLRTLG